MTVEGHYQQSYKEAETLKELNAANEHQIVDLNSEMTIQQVLVLTVYYIYCRVNLSTG